MLRPNNRVLGSIKWKCSGQALTISMLWCVNQHKLNWAIYYYSHLKLFVFVDSHQASEQKPSSPLGRRTRGTGSVLSWVMQCCLVCRRHFRCRMPYTTYMDETWDNINHNEIALTSDLLLMIVLYVVSCSALYYL